MTSFLIFLAVSFLAISPVSDFDSWTHLSFGRLIVEHRLFVSQEPFVYPNLSSTITNPYWLFQIPLYLSFKAGGTAGVVVFRALVIAGAFTAFSKLLREMGLRSGVLVFCATVTAALLSRFRFVDRPEIFAYLFFLIFLLAFTRAYYRPRTRFLYLVPPVQVLWANSHPSASLGILVACIFLGGFVLEKHLVRNEMPSGASRKVAAGILITVCVVLGYLMNPYTVTYLLSPVTLATTPSITEAVQEMQPVTMSTTYLIPYLVVLCLALLAIALNRKRIPVAWILLVLIFAYVSFRVVRSLPFFFFVSVPVIAVSFHEKFIGKKVLKTVFSAIFPALLTAVLLITGIYGKTGFGFGEESRLFPSGAISFLQEKGLDRGRIFNYFGWGGYVSWKLGEGRTFIDGRYVAGELSDDYDHIIAASQKWKGLLEKYRVEVILVNSIGITDGMPYPLIIALGKDPDWKAVYADSTGLIFVKRAGYEQIAEISSDRILAQMIDEAEYLSSLGVKGEIEKTLGGLYLKNKDYPNAKIHYGRWLKRNPGDTYARGMYELLQQKGY